MTLRKGAMLVLATLVLSSLAPAAAAQEQQAQDSTTTGEDNEFGSIRMPYQAEIEPGVTYPVTATVVLRTLYEDRDATYYMFGITGENTPLTVTLDSVRVGDQELPAYQKDSDGKVAKWFIDIKRMPPVGTEITVEGTVTAPKAGFWQVGSLVVPFTYRWEKVMMSNNIEAKLYGFTQIAVNGDAGKADFAGGGNKLPVPGFTTFAAPAMLGLAALALAARRKR